MKPYARIALRWVQPSHNPKTRVSVSHLHTRAHKARDTKRLRKGEGQIDTLTKGNIHARGRQTETYRDQDRETESNRSEKRQKRMTERLKQDHEEDVEKHEASKKEVRWEVRQSLIVSRIINCKRFSTKHQLAHRQIAPQTDLYSVPVPSLHSTISTYRSYYGLEKNSRITMANDSSTSQHGGLWLKTFILFILTLQHAQIDNLHTSNSKRSSNSTAVIRNPEIAKFQKCMKFWKFVEFQTSFIWD